MNDILSQIIAYAPNKIDTETKARAMVQGPRNMYNQGQLVQPNADGSRPGYAGDDFVNLNDIKKYNKNLLDKSIIVSTAPGRTGANQVDPVTLRNIFNVVEKTKDGDVLINNFKKNPTSENFLKLKTRRKNRLAFEKEQALPAEQKAELRKKQLIAEKKWRASGKGQSYYNELLAKDGIFPARTAQERVWRDIYRASKQSKEDSRFKIKYPKNIEIDPETNLPKKVKAKSGKYYIPWDRYYKKVSFYDTETKSTIKFGNMREWMKNNVKGGGTKYDNAIQNYNLRQNIADFDVDGKSLGAVAKEKKTGLYAKKLTTPAAVNHRSGLNNFWDTEITTSTGNAQLNDKVQSRISAYKNASNPNIKNKIMKQMKAEINKIQGGATLVVDGETIGKKPTLKKVSNALAKELDVDLLKLASTVTDQCRIGNAIGGRIGFKTAGSVDCLSIGKKTAKDLMEKGLKNGFPKNQQGDLARKILGSGKFLKDAVSLRGLFGPAALAFTAAAEAGIVGYDMLSSGKSFREAVGDSVFNYALGDKTKIDSDEEFIKRLKNIKVGPQGYQRMGEAEIGKMLNFKTNLDDMQKGFSLYDQLQNVDQAILDNRASDTTMFGDNAFQLEAQKDKIQADIQDYNRTGTPQRVTDYFLSDKATKGADASALADLLVRQDQLKDAGTGGVLPGVDKGIAKNLKQTQYGINKLLNPTKLDEFGEYFISRPQSEQSYIMGLGYKEGGIASLNVKK